MRPLEYDRRLLRRARRHWGVDLAIGLLSIAAMLAVAVGWLYMVWQPGW